MAPISWGIKSFPGSIAAITRALPYLCEGALVPPVCVDTIAAAAVDGAVSDKLIGRCTTMTAFDLVMMR